MDTHTSTPPQRMGMRAAWAKACAEAAYRAGRFFSPPSYGTRISAPGGSGAGSLVNDPELTAIGGLYGKSAAQVMIRWELQHGIITIPKSSHPDTFTF